MAEKPEWVAGFDRPKGTEIKHIRGNWYLYERSWRYDPKIKRSRKVSGRCLGKITPEGFVPSARREERAAAEAADTAKVAEAAKVADVVEVGASSFAWSLTADMRERLRRHFPARWREVYALAIMRAVSEPALRRSATHLEDSALSEALGHPNLTPASISTLLRDLGEARRTISAFMRESLAPDGRILLFDANGVLPSSRASDVEELALGPKTTFRPQTNLVYAFSAGKASVVPVFYRRYAGVTPDVTAFADLLEESGEDASRCLVVAGEALSSEEDFALLEDMGLGYVVPLERHNRFVAGRIPTNPADWNDAFSHDGGAAMCMTLPQEGFNVHAFLDTELYAFELSDVSMAADVENDRREARRLAEERRRSRGAGRLTDEQLAALAPIPVISAIRESLGLGTVALRSDRTDLTAPAAYALYREAQAIERIFETYGEALRMDATWMASDAATEGLLFLNHLSATIATSITEAIAAAGHADDVSYQDCVQALSKVRACRMGDGSWQAVPPQRKVTALCEKLGIDPCDLSLLDDMEDALD